MEDINFVGPDKKRKKSQKSDNRSTNTIDDVDERPNKITKHMYDYWTDVTKRLACIIDDDEEEEGIVADGFIEALESNLPNNEEEESSSTNVDDDFQENIAFNPPTIYSNVDQHIKKVLSMKHIKRENIDRWWDDIYEKWCSIENIDNINDFYGGVVEKLGFDRNNLAKITLDMLDIALAKETFTISYIGSKYAELAEKEDNNDLLKREETNKVRKMMCYQIGSVRTYLETRNMIAGKVVDENTYNKNIVKYVGLDESECNSFQNLLLYILKKLATQQYRRYNGYCYKAIYSHNDRYTFAWLQHQDIKTFIYNNCSKDMAFDQWLNLTQSHNVIPRLCQYLSECNEPEFPELIKDRHMFSFKNGLYISKIIDETTGKVHDAFYPYNRVDVNKIDIQRASCKYFDMEFDDDEPVSGDWWDIPTVQFQKILDYQWLPKNNRAQDKDTPKDMNEWEEVCRWMYALIGKVLYDVRELDRWEVAPYIIGIAGSGKSTIGDVVQSLYEQCDVGHVSNNIDKVYGVAALKDSLVCYGPEIKTKWSMEPTDLQKMISGESVKIREMYKDPTSMPNWKSPLFLIGNEPPDFRDKQGQISRRIIYFYFSRVVSVHDKNPQLYKLLQQEVPSILRKCNRAYHDFVNRYSEQDIWKVLPAYFKVTKRLFQDQPLTKFLTSPDNNIEFGEDKHVTWEAFRITFQQWVKDTMGGMEVHLSPKDTEIPFNDIGEEKNIIIEYVDNITLPVDGRPMTTRFIRGLTLVPQPFNSCDDDQYI